MSHTKKDRQPFEDRFPELRRYLVACSACGRKGRDARVDWENFQPAGFGPWITEAVADWYAILSLDARGLCHACASGLRIANSPLGRPT